MKTLLIFSLFCFLVCAELDLGDLDIPDIDDFTEIKEHCDERGGNGTYNNLKASLTSLQTCFQNFVNPSVLKDEVEAAKKTGSMEEVFGKYCNKRVQLIPCVQNFTNSLKPCLNDEEKNALNISIDIMKQLGEFVCYKDGDRIAMFIAEGGIECINNHTQGIQNCANATFKITPNVNTNVLPNLLMDKKKCDDLGTLQECVVGELEKCKDATPANVVDALFRFVKRSVCKKKRSANYHEIVKRRDPLAAPPSLESMETLYDKFFSIIEERCSKNSSYDQLQKFKRTIALSMLCTNRASTNLKGSLKNAKKLFRSCFEDLIEESQKCLPKDEQYLPEFLYKIMVNMLNFAYLNSDIMTRPARGEYINCFYALKEKEAWAAVQSCFNPLADFDEKVYDFSKEHVCKDLLSVRFCLSGEIDNRCIPDVELYNIFTDNFDSITKDCKN